MVLRISRILSASLVILFLGFPAAAALSMQAEGLALRGRVTDTVTGEPLPRVLVSAIGLDRKTTTDMNGDFVLADLPAGPVQLYVSAVGYGVVKKQVTLLRGEPTELLVALHPENAPQLSEEVTVTAPLFELQLPEAPSGHELKRTELSALSTVLTADPIRAAQGLPGVSGNDDFRSELIFRGAGFRRLGFHIDGLQVDHPVHTQFGDDNAGSISILNSDAVSSVSLYGGAFPARFSDGTAGALSLETRAGNRARPTARAATSLLSSSALADGPFSGDRGSWLITARKSYLNYVLDRLTEDEDEDSLIIDFLDGQSKVLFDLGPNQQAGFTALLGRSTFDDRRPAQSVPADDIFRSRSSQALLYAHWAYVTPRMELQARGFRIDGTFSNANRDGMALIDGGRRQHGARADAYLPAGSAHRIEAGAYVRVLSGRGFQRTSLQDPLPLGGFSFHRRGTQQGYYLQDSWRTRPWSLSLTGGLRFDSSALNDEGLVTPRAALAFSPWESTQLRFGWGQYAQFPEFEHLFGPRGNRRLRAERATHYNASMEHRLGTQTRVVGELFYRRERGLLFRLNDLLLREGQVQLLDLPFHNSVRGYARGFELSLHRRSAAGLSGWIAYSFTATRLTDSQSGLSFVSDFDQRHTLSTYAGYRFSDSVQLSAQWRFGSGRPMAGFYRPGEFRLLPAAERNQVRLPVYSRLDLRISKAFHLRRSKWTLSGEVLNVLARDNFRQDGRHMEKLLPFLPSFGLVVEF